MGDAGFAQLPPPGRGRFRASPVAPEEVQPTSAGLGERLGKRVAVGAVTIRVALSDPGGFYRRRPVAATARGGASVYGGNLAKHPG